MLTRLRIGSRNLNASFTASAVLAALGSSGFLVSSLSSSDALGCACVSMTLSSELGLGASGVGSRVLAGGVLMFDECVCADDGLRSRCECAEAARTLPGVGASQLSRDDVIELACGERECCEFGLETLTAAPAPGAPADTEISLPALPGGVGAVVSPLLATFSTSTSSELASEECGRRGTETLASCDICGCARGAESDTDDTDDADADA